MTIYEQHTFFLGEMEIIDSDTGRVIARKRKFTPVKKCILCGEHFAPGDQVQVIFPPGVNLAEAEGTGPWAPGGRSSSWMKAHASRITEAGRGKVIFSKE